MVLRALPSRGVVRVKRRGKPSPIYYPFKVLIWVGSIACELALPPACSIIHHIFYLSMLRCCILNELHVLRYDAIE